MKKLTVLILIALLAALAGGIAAQDEPIEIVFVHIFGGEQDSRVEVVRAIADEFEALNPNVRITLQSPSTSYVELFNAVLLGASQGNAPHIVQVEEGLTQLAADSGFFVPIDQLASAEQIASLDDMMPVVLNYYSIGETLWSVPWNSSNPVLYYNRGMMELAGLDPDAPPATFAELTSACEAIMAIQEELGVTGCINWPMATWFVEQWMAMKDALIANNDNGRSARATEMLYTSPEMVEIIEWWAEMAERGFYVYSGQAGDYNGEGIAFLSRRTAFTINSTAGMTLFINFSRAQSIELGVARLPIPDETATNGVTVGGASLWITNGHTEAELQAANDFIFFLTSTENDMKWHKGSGYFPNRVSSIEALEAEGWFERSPFFRIALDQLLESNSNVSNQGAITGPSAEVRGILVEAVQSIIDGGIAVEEALAAAKIRADRVLAEYNALVGE